MRGVLVSVCSIIFTLAVPSGGFVVHIFLSNIGMGVSARGQQKEWARKVANLFRARGSAENGPAVLVAAAKVLGVYPIPPPPPNLHDPGPYLEFPAKTLDFAISRVNPGTP